jgi:hypothetical protein
MVPTAWKNGRWAIRTMFWNTVSIYGLCIEGARYPNQVAHVSYPLNYSRQRYLLLSPLEITSILDSEILSLRPEETYSKRTGSAHQVYTKYIECSLNVLLHPSSKCHVGLTFKGYFEHQKPSLNSTNARL